MIAYALYPCARMRRPLLALLLFAALAAAAVPALAATKNGIRPQSPKAGAKLPLAEAPTFRGRARGKGPVWVFVCKSRRRDKLGLICNDAMIERARKRRNGRFSVTPRFVDYPEFWLNQPGVYYWQAHRIHCSGTSRDCAKEGPVVRFRVG